MSWGCSCFSSNRTPVVPVARPAPQQSSSSDTRVSSVSRRALGRGSSLSGPVGTAPAFVPPLPASSGLSTGLAPVLGNAPAPAVGPAAAPAPKGAVSPSVASTQPVSPPSGEPAAVVGPSPIAAPPVSEDLFATEPSGARLPPDFNPFGEVIEDFCPSGSPKRTASRSDKAPAAHSNSNRPAGSVSVSSLELGPTAAAAQPVPPGVGALASSASSNAAQRGSASPSRYESPFLLLDPAFAAAAAAAAAAESALKRSRGTIPPSQ